MADMTHKFQDNRLQPPRGTRDFYPADMALRRYIESVWREVSINHGFEEIDGPTFEHLELYTRKSGEEIVSQLFSFRRAEGDTDYALRPEFTPTLARMYAARAGQLPKPTKWFCIPSFFRAERPQRGRLREFFQWNIDVLGDDSPRADAEVIACVIDVLKAFGLTSDRVKVKISDRRLLTKIFDKEGLDEAKCVSAFQLLDRAPKLTVDEYRKGVDDAGLPRALMELLRTNNHSPDGITGEFFEVAERIGGMSQQLFHFRNSYLPDYSDWIDPDLTIARGLAYYTGTVFEVHEVTGKERAIAGGGRYDGLVELFGGPPTPAVGVAMGDVVLRLMLEDHGLLPSEAEIADRIGARPDVFIICAKEETDSDATRLIGQLRTAGLHVRQSYKSTRNVGKLLGDADKCHARYAVIVGDELKDNQVVVKELETGEQETVAVDALTERLQRV